MLIAGAGNHAKDILADPKLKDIVLFDDITKPSPDLFLGSYSILATLKDADEYLAENKEFIIGIGGTFNRKKINDKLTDLGGRAVTYRAPYVVLGRHNVILDEGINIMPFVFLANKVEVGYGSLLNTKSSLHHDVQVGKYCNIAPNATVLGGAKIADFTIIGSNATVLPGVKIGSNCIVGAGSVVTKDIDDDSIVMGVPAKRVKNK